MEPSPHLNYGHLNAVTQYPQHSHSRSQNQNEYSSLRHSTPIRSSSNHHNSQYHHSNTPFLSQAMMSKTSNGVYHDTTVHNSTANQSDDEEICCGFSSLFILYILFVFHIIFFMAGLLILVVINVYGTPGSSAIRSLVPMTHALNIVYYSLLAIGSAMCLTGLFNVIFSCCCRPKRRRNSRRSSKNKPNRRSISPDMIATDPHDLNLDDMDLEIGFTSEFVNSDHGMNGNGSNGNGYHDHTNSSHRSNGNSGIQRNGHHRDSTRVKMIPKNASRGDTSSPKLPSCFLCTFILTLLLIFTTKLIVSFMGFVSTTSMDNILLAAENPSVNSSLQSSPSSLVSVLMESIHSELDSSIKIPQVLYDKRSAFDRIESIHKCCGLLDYTDYPSFKKNHFPDDSNGTEQQQPLPVPHSCCRTPTENCGIRRHPSNIYYSGCSLKIFSSIRDELVLLSSLALGFSSLEIFGIIFSCCLYMKIIVDSRQSPSDL